MGGEIVGPIYPLIVLLIALYKYDGTPCDEIIYFIDIFINL